MSILSHHDIGKVCTGCNQRKPLAQYDREGTTVTGAVRIRAKCKACRSAERMGRFTEKRAVVADTLKAQIQLNRMWPA